MPIALSEWETFYVITGSSGAALTGLMFVVIALVTERFPTPRPTLELSAFATPTLVHFTLVLLVAAVMTVPHHATLTLGLGVATCALVGLIYSTVSTVRMHRLEQYEPVADDWLWHIILPFVAYATLLASAIALRWSGEAALYMVAATVLSLLVIGIHNAWDVAVFTATNSGRPRPEAGSASVETDAATPRNP